MRAVVQPSARQQPEAETPEREPARIRVLVVDDHPAVRIGLSELLEAEEDFVDRRRRRHGRGRAGRRRTRMDRRRGRRLSTGRSKRPMAEPQAQAAAASPARRHLFRLLRRPAGRRGRGGGGRRPGQQGQSRLRAHVRDRQRRPRPAAAAGRPAAPGGDASPAARPSRTGNFRDASGRNPAARDRPTLNMSFGTLESRQWAMLRKMQAGQLDPAPGRTHAATERRRSPRRSLPR